jgi:hypothetical protein
VVISEVEVEVEGGGTEVRVVAFASKSGLPQDLADVFERYDIPVMEGDNVDRPYSDAEFAARDFGQEVAAQLKQLGGRIVRVNSAISSNSVCSDECGEALTEYVNRPGVTIEKNGYGVIGDEVLNPEQIASIQD